MKKRSYDLDKYGNKADWQFQVDVEFDSSCNIEIVAIHEYVPTTDRWIDSTEYVKKLETLYLALSESATRLVMDEPSFLQYEADCEHERGIDSDIDSYRDSMM